MKGKFEIVSEVENDDGTWTLNCDVDDEFQEWFKEWQGLKRWSHKRFQKVLHEALINAIEQGENSENDKP
jgi:hypothetical protein